MAIQNSTTTGNVDIPIIRNAGVLRVVTNSTYGVFELSGVRGLFGTLTQFNGKATFSSTVRMNGLPSSSSGLSTGDLYKSGGYVRIV